MSEKWDDLVKEKSPREKEEEAKKIAQEKAKENATRTTRTAPVRNEEGQQETRNTYRRNEESEQSAGDCIQQAWTV